MYEKSPEFARSSSKIVTFRDLSWEVVPLKFGLSALCLSERQSESPPATPAVDINDWRKPARAVRLWRVSR